MLIGNKDMPVEGTGTVENPNEMGENSQLSSACAVAEKMDIDELDAFGGGGDDDEQEGDKFGGLEGNDDPDETEKNEHSGCEESDLIARGGGEEVVRESPTNNSDAGVSENFSQSDSESKQNPGTDSQAPRPGQKLRIVIRSPNVEAA